MTTTLLKDNLAMTEQAADDFAQVEISTPFDREFLLDFVSDPHRLLGINSFFEFTDFAKTDHNHWHISGKNLANEQVFDVTFSTQKKPDGLLIVYDGWLKHSTEVSIKMTEEGRFSLVIRDDYSAVSHAERTQRINEVDNTIVQWGHDIHRYLQQWKRWSWLPGFQWYMLKFWQKMKPSARRISFMLIAITGLEFILFLFVFVIFWLELGL